MASMDDGSTQIRPHRFQFRLLTLLICVTSIGLACGSLKLARYSGDNLLLIIATLIASGAFWGGAVGALFGRYWRCAVVGALTAGLAIGLFIRFAREIIIFLMKYF